MGKAQTIYDVREQCDPRILLWDIETAPILAHVWGAYEQNLLWKEHDSYLLSVAWKWLGDSKVQCAALNEYEMYEQDPRDDYPLVQLAWNLFDEADVVVAHNGVAFDTKRTNARIIIQGLDRPSPFKEVDTLTLARKVFAFTKNNLDEIVRDLGIGEKIQTGGIDLWRAIVERDDPKAWALMKRYNKHDVQILEALYLRLRQWDDRHPNLATIGDRPNACPKCFTVGGMVIRGYRHTAVSVRANYRCNACGGYSQGRQIFKTGTEFVN
jgi:RNase_H superfamily